MPAGRRAATAFVGLFQGLGLTLVDHQAVIVIEFLAAFDIPQSVNIDAFLFFARFAVWFARMIDPACIAAIDAAIDHLAAFEAEEEGVIRIFRIGAVALGGLFVADAFTFVLDQKRVGWNTARGKNAAAVYR